MLRPGRHASGTSRRASEAALKYAVFGAGAAGVMLYGISLLAGVLGSAQLPTMAARLIRMHPRRRRARPERGAWSWAG